MFLNSNIDITLHAKRSVTLTYACYKLKKGTQLFHLFCERIVGFIRRLGS